MIHEKVIEVVSPDGEVKVSLEYIGEGNEGNYDANNSEDTALCRFSIYRRFHIADSHKIEELCDRGSYEEGEWMAVRDGSYCTQLNATAPVSQLTDAAQFILNKVVNGVRNFKHEKRLYERLSWIELQDGKVA